MLDERPKLYGLILRRMSPESKVKWPKTQTMIHGAKPQTQRNYGKP
jgi:hypothetical protein